VGQDEIQQRPRLRLRDLVRASAVGVLLVAVHEVHVEVNAADAVLVVLTVTVVIDAFDIQGKDGPLALVPIGGDVKTRLVGVRHQVRFVGFVHPHHRDQAVVVEIVGRVLVVDAVAIQVVGTHVAPELRPHVGEVPLGAVGIDPGNDVQRVIGQEGDRLLIALVREAQETLRNGEGNGAAHEVIAVDVRHEEHGRAGVGLDVAIAGQTQRPDGPALAARADRLDGARAAIRRGEGIDRRRKLGVRVIFRFRTARRNKKGASTPQRGAHAKLIRHRTPFLRSPVGA
jgi:hypothetical protein